jgi:hypothetical protein
MPKLCVEPHPPGRPRPIRGRTRAATVGGAVTRAAAMAGVTTTARASVMATAVRVATATTPGPPRPPSSMSSSRSLRCSTLGTPISAEGFNARPCPRGPRPWLGSPPPPALRSWLRPSAWLRLLLRAPRVSWRPLRRPMIVCPRFGLRHRWPALVRVAAIAAVAGATILAVPGVVAVGGPEPVRIRRDGLGRSVEGRERPRSVGPSRGPRPPISAEGFNARPCPGMP